MATITLKKKLLFLTVFLLVGMIGIDWIYRAVLHFRGMPASAAAIEGAMRESIASMSQTLPGAAEDEEEEEKKKPTNPNSPIETTTHPYLGFAVDDNSGDINRWLFPKPADEYWLMLVGGSVAGLTGRHGYGVFKKMLGADPRFAGKKVQILRYGRGAYKQPQQTIMLSYLLSVGIQPDAVINIDGFNEVAIGMGNASLGVHPTFPSTYQWSRLVAKKAISRDAIDRLAAIRQAEKSVERAARRAESLWLTKSAILGTASLMRVQTLRGRWAQQCEDYLEYRAANEVEASQTGPMYSSKSGGQLRAALRAWYNSSISIQGICERHGIGYLHVLQPTLHDEGAKLITAEEARTGHMSDAWMKGVKQGYPLLREGGKQLAAEEGIKFFDASMLFKDNDETIYYDACHFNAGATRKFAMAIAEQFLAQVEIDSPR